MIIWVASFPRSGNSLVMNLLWSLCGCQTSSIYDETKDIELSRLYKLYGYNQLTYEKFSCWMIDHRPHFIKIHNACADQLPVLYIVRDGRDVMCSFAHFNIAMGRSSLSFEDELHRCITNKGFSWSRRVLWWTKKRSSFAPTVVVKFEDLLVAPALTLFNALERLKVSVNVSGFPVSFETLQQIEPRQFRTGQAGIWREEMSSELQEIFWAEHKEAMRELEYSQ